jgi:hypothetical protein
LQFERRDILLSEENDMANDTCQGRPVEIAGGGQSPGVPQKRIRELSLLFIMHRSSSHLLFVKFVHTPPKLHKQN